MTPRAILNPTAAVAVITCALSPAASSQPVGSLRTPSGYRVTIFAEGLDAPGQIAFGPDGELYVTLAGSGTVARLADEDGDHRADRIETVVRGLDQPVDIAWRDDALWILEADRLLRSNAEGEAVAAPRVVIDDFPGGAARAMVFSAGGEAVLVAIAGSCETCSPGDRGGVLRYELSGGPPRLVARGLARPGGLGFNPTTGELWVTDAGVPGLGSELPPGELNVVRRGRDYGWPYCYGARVPFPAYADRARCEGTEPPALLLPGRSQPWGIAFGRGAADGPWGGDAVMVMSADTAGRTAAARQARLVRVEFRSGRPASTEDLTTDWGVAVGRPVDVLVGRDGGLYVTDDAGGRIWRVEPPVTAGSRVTPGKGTPDDRAG